MSENDALKNIKIRKPVIIVKDFSAVNAPDADVLSDFLSKIKAEGRVLIVSNESAQENQTLAKAAEKLENVKVMQTKDVKSSDFIEADCIVAADKTIESITERLSK